MMRKKEWKRSDGIGSKGSQRIWERLKCPRTIFVKGAWAIWAKSLKDERLWMPQYE
jgi:hypothetical protein